MIQWLVLQFLPSKFSWLRHYWAILRSLAGTSWCKLIPVTDSSLEERFLVLLTFYRQVLRASCLLMVLANALAFIQLYHWDSQNYWVGMEMSV